MEIGTIVSLKSNSFLQLANNNFLSLGGNENFVTPLMVVVEVLYNKDLDIDEETGEIKEKAKGNNKYKCVYFSNKKMKLEENWFSENELEIYGKELDKIHKTETVKNLHWGETVRFKTIDEEGRKTKSFTKEEKQKGFKPLLTFTSPAMQIVGFAKCDDKESLIDSRTGKEKRKKSTMLVKCKFFNVDLDKFSEILIPIECLQKIDNTKVLNNYLERISSFIKEDGSIIIKSGDHKYFGKPKAVNVFSDRYQLSFYNELTKSNELIWIDLIDDFELVEINVGEYFPSVQKGTGEFVTVFDHISKKKEDIKKSHFKITYRNLKEQIVSRYITVKEVNKVLGKEDSTTNNDSEGYYYLKAHCHLRKAEREFRSDRILSLRTIEDQSLKNLLNRE